MQNLVRSLKFSWSFSLLWYFLFGLLLPIQLGKHFWPDFAFVSGIRSDYLSPTIYLTDLLLLVFPFLINRPLKLKLTFFGLSLFLILLLNFLLSPQKLLWVYRLWQYLKIAGIAYLFWQSRPKERQIFLSGSLIGAAYSLCLVMLQLMNQGSLQGIWYLFGERAFTLQTPGIATVSFAGQRLLRAYGSFSHPNTLAGFYLAVTALFIVFRRYWSIIFTIPLILLSFSKFAIILLALLPFLTLLNQKQPCRLCWLGKFFLGIWLVAFTFLYQGDPRSLSERLLSYREVVLFIAHHPLGTGLGSYLAPLLPPRLQPVHNIWLLITLELGLFVWPFLAYLASKVVTQVKSQPQWLLVVALIFLTGSFDHYWLTQVQTQGMIGVLLGFILSVGSSRKTRS